MISDWVGGIIGIRNGVTVTALTPLKVFVLTKDDIGKAIKVKPEVAMGLEELARRSHLALQRLATERQKQDLAEPDRLLHKLREFLHLLAT